MHIKANVCKNDCTCECNRLSMHLFHVNGNEKNVVIVVKRYAVREAEKWRYTVRKAKIGRYAVRNGGGGVTLNTVIIVSDLFKYITFQLKSI